MRKSPNPNAWTREEVNSWPEGMKRCKLCKELLSIENFHKDKNSQLGRHSNCKQCRIPKSKQQWASKDLQRRIYDRARSRATKKGIEFNISVDDIVIPERCPALGIKISPSLERHSPDSASIDRINPHKGYVKGNVQIISMRANMLKNNATSKELRLIADFIDTCLV